MQSKQQKYQPKHLILPAEAIIALDVLETIVDGCKPVHVAFVLGISVKHLAKQRKELEAAARGDERACADFNSRCPLLRNLGSLYHLLEVDDEYVKGLLHDALLWADPKHNVVHRRGGKEIQLAGLDSQEREDSLSLFTNYHEN